MIGCTGDFDPLYLTLFILLRLTKVKFKYCEVEDTREFYKDVRKIYKDQGGERFREDLVEFLKRKKEFENCIEVGGKRQLLKLKVKTLFCFFSLLSL